MDQLAYVQVRWIFLPKPEWRYRPLAVDMDPTVPACLELLGHVRFRFKWITVVISDHYVQAVLYSRMSKSLKDIRHNCKAVTVWNVPHTHTYTVFLRELKRRVRHDPVRWHKLTLQTVILTEDATEILKLNDFFLTVTLSNTINLLKTNSLDYPFQPVY